MPYAVNPVELGQFILFSVLCCPPNFLWQSWLEGRFPGYADKLSQREQEQLVDDVVTGQSSSPCLTSEKTKAMTTESTTPKNAMIKAKNQLNVTNTAIKFALDQTFGAAVNTVLFIAGIALLRGHSFPSIQDDVRNKFWPMIFAGQKLWPLVSILSFTIIPFEHRTLFGSVVGLFWGIYLSLISGGAK